MAKGRAGSKTRTEDESPCVKCDNCGRWVYRDETPFPDLDAAKEAEFRRSICQKMEDLEERLSSRHKQACEALQAELIRLESSVQSMAKQLQHLQVQQQQPPGSSPTDVEDNHLLGRPRDKLETTPAAEDPERAAAHEAIAMETTDNYGSPAVDEAQRAGGHTTRRRVTAATPTSVPRPEESRETSKYTQQTCGLKHKASNRSQVTQINRAISRSLSNIRLCWRRLPTKPPIEAKEGDKWDGTESPRSCRNSQSCPPMGTQKEVVLVGDKNIEIVAEIVVAELGSPTALKCISGRSATAADAIAYATKYDKEAEARTRQYIMHAGLHDVLRGKPEDVTKALNLQWTGRPRSLIVCSIPEIYGRGGETRAAVVLANAKIKKWCRRTGNRFLDLAKVVQSTGFQKDGLHYNERTAMEVGRVIGRVAAPSLGLGLSHQREKGATKTTTPCLGKSLCNEPPGPPHRSWEPTQHRLSNRGKRGQGNRTDPEQGRLAQLIEKTLEKGSGGAVRRRPRHPKAQQRRRRVQHQNPGRISIAFLNLHGGRRLVKWEELYIGMEEEGITLYGVAETHLRDLERPPVNPLWNWAGCNRESTARGGGGVGFLGERAAPGHRSTAAVRNTPGMLATCTQRRTTNIVHCIRQDIERWGQGHEVLILGDFKATSRSSTVTLTTMGGLLLEMTQELSLEIANLRADCEGTYTWCARGLSSCIDYALVSPGEETRACYAFLPMRHTRNGHEFELCPGREQADTYEQYIAQLRQIMLKHEKIVKARRGFSRKSWWDGEVQAAIKSPPNRQPMSPPVCKRPHSEDVQGDMAGVSAANNGRCRLSHNGR
ncbi:hypothetical protein HPB52_012960 [Rhipicephalus sanguineus]|uniref:Uncharacterized protein n=1 Tax=Rhipicephalus sanguineus TaxID=34632 RepID=A0A9D4SNE3_RHISA|nr:hypothetical protein HPB52_012960 [Rhipicephalus sanguineus]